MSTDHAAMAAASAEATPDQPEGAAPVTGGARLANLDFIRGIAVLGILAANIVAFGQTFSAYMWPAAWNGPVGDPLNWLWAAQFVIIDGKMRGLFTLLFGVGMALFMERAWAQGETRALQVRRLLFLLGFGFIHFFFIWRGDILMLYALTGLIALTMIGMRPKRQILLGGLLYLGGFLFYLLALALPYFVVDTAFGDAPAFAPMRDVLLEAQEIVMADEEREIAIMTGGNYWQFVSHNFTAHWTDPINTVFSFLFETLPLMLFGMGLYRLGLFSGTMPARKVALWGWAGVIVGTALTVWLALSMRDQLTYWGSVAAFTAFMHLPRLPVVLGLAALLALYGASAQGWLAERLSAAGRVAFTNYIGTSVLMMLVFHPWAGGLWGELTRPELYLVVLLGWAVMLWWSKPWLERYRYGPLEWLWRCLTYGRRFPLRR